jgi:signal peptidase I
MQSLSELNRLWLQEAQGKTPKPEFTVQKPLRKSSAQRRPVWKDLLFLLVKVISIALIFILLFTFLFGIIRYQEPSMAPSIKDGDLVLYYRYTKAGYLPQDVIALEYNGRRQTRRVVATAGDTVDITADGLVVNGALQQEPEIYQKTERYQDSVDFPLTVPEGQVFVLSDSRTGATDSRIYGCVKIEDTLGKVMTVIRRRGI